MKLIKSKKYYLWGTLFGVFLFLGYLIIDAWYEREEKRAREIRNYKAEIGLAQSNDLAAQYRLAYKHYRNISPQYGIGNLSTATWNYMDDKIKTRCVYTKDKELSAQREKNIFGVEYEEYDKHQKRMVNNVYYLTCEEHNLRKAIYWAKKAAE